MKGNVNVLTSISIFLNSIYYFVLFLALQTKRVHFFTVFALFKGLKNILEKTF